MATDYSESRLVQPGGFLLEREPCSIFFGNYFPLRSSHPRKCESDSVGAKALPTTRVWEGAIVDSSPLRSERGNTNYGNCNDDKTKQTEN